ncbi:protein FAM81B [Antennarius striatus]|uniref:protein FAM81B n=1 Tax=Antennarius striatus TaxID=241820 RepID=UPI0035AE89F7
MSHKSKPQSNQNHMRPDNLEGRLVGQERTLAVLLEEAFRIKDEVASSLQSTKSSAQVEAFSRKLLENHILTVTRIVKQLSLDIQTLERQMAQRDVITAGTNMAVQSLDQKTLASIGDLRGSVARCDATITKLGADVNAWDRQLNRIQQKVSELRSTVDTRFKELEAKVRNDLKRVEASLSEHSQSQRSAMSDLQSRLQLLENRMSGEVEEAKELTASLTKWTEQELSSSDRRCTLREEQLLTTVSGFSDRMHALEARVEKFETQLKKAERCQAGDLKHSDARLAQRMSSVENGLHEEMQLLKQEYHKGFQSVHDTIESLRQIGEIKSHLNMKKLQKQNVGVV